MNADHESKSLNIKSNPEELQPMSINVEMDRSLDLVESEYNYSSIFSVINVDNKHTQSACKQLIYMTIVLIVILFAVVHIFPNSISNSIGDESELVHSTDLSFGGRIIFNKPNNLNELIQLTYDRAKSNNLLSSMVISNFEHISEQSIKFIIYRSNSNSSQGNNSPKDNTNNFVKFNQNHQKLFKLENYDSTPSNNNFIDPLDTASIDKNLIVHHFNHSKQISLDANESQSLREYGSGYTLALNKFNSLENHCLLVSDEFIEQSLPLTSIDFELWHWIIDDINGIGFYNSNLFAGASQTHKHMQVIPSNSFWKYRPSDSEYPIPIDDIIMPCIEDNTWHYYDPFTSNSFVFHQIPQFDFKHSIAMLKPRIRFINEMAFGDYLFSTYSKMLQVNNISMKRLQECSKIILDSLLSESANTFNNSSHNSSHPNSLIENCIADNSYNLILSPLWMMIIPRSAPKYDNKITVNSF
eukprot:gene6486-8919_t